MLLLDTSGLWQVAQYSGLSMRPALLWKPTRSWQVLQLSMSTMERRSVFVAVHARSAAVPLMFMPLIVR
jgi:hypothetical protein